MEDMSVRLVDAKAVDEAVKMIKIRLSEPERGEGYLIGLALKDQFINLGLWPEGEE